MARPAWLAPAAVLIVTAWGSNQFAPILLVYHHALGLGTGTLEALFGVYALGLIPGLLLAGPLSDARGRRIVVIPAAILALVASLALVAGAHHVPMLFAGRLLAGISAGAVFAAGTAWLRELTPAAADGRDAGAAARRAAVFMTAGFALGPLAAGLVAQWVPDPRVTAYVPHIALTLAVLLAVRGAPETVTRLTRWTPRRSLPEVRNTRFLGVVAPMAPWVFAAPAIAFALLPSIVGADRARDGIALTAAITCLTAMAGVLIQSLGRRLDRSRRPTAVIGLITLSGGLVLAAFTAQAGDIWLLAPTAIVLGSAYGLCFVAGLIEIQRLADGHSLAGMTAAYYALTYIGFAAPYLLSLSTRLTGYPALLLATAALALATAALVSRRITGGAVTVVPVGSRS
jgi:predicted MFS family arabinose efflux permease